MNVALLVSYYDEAAVWPRVWESIAALSPAPTEIVLCVDSADAPLPAVGGAGRLQVVRSPPRFDGLRTVGVPINIAARLVESPVVVHVDADVLCHPYLCGAHVSALIKGTQSWRVVCRDGALQDVARPRNRHVVTVGPNSYVPDDWDIGRSLAHPSFGWRWPYGQRGRETGQWADLHGCNWACLTETLRRYPLPEHHSFNEDQEWADGLAAVGAAVIPAPEFAVVAHLGPDSHGRGLRDETHPGWAYPEEAYRECGLP